MGGLVNEEGRLVLITGMSGAGKTQALHALEDMGYFAVDNIPPELIPKLLDLVHSAHPSRRAAFVVDCRQDGFFGGIQEALQVLKRLSLAYDVLFLDAADDTLIRRYKESRRSHPLAPTGSVPDGIRLERERLSPVRKEAIFVLDTSELSPYQLKERLGRMFGRDLRTEPIIRLVSFGFKFGTPADADVVLDVRGLPNPYYDPDLNPLTGMDERVKNFVRGDEKGRNLLSAMEGLLRAYLHAIREEGRAAFVMAIGCTGGRHRSVATVEIMRERLGDLALPIVFEHRDLERGASPSEIS